jgi:stage III sporulation protein AA
MIDEIIKRASEHSFYAYSNQIKQGFITVSGGIRIGLTGEVVLDGTAIKTVKNINALNIRIPHQIYGCAEEVISYIELCPDIRGRLFCRSDRYSQGAGYRKQLF